jgi:hypothetical protein
LSASQCCCCSRRWRTAVDSIVLEVREMTITGLPVSGTNARLDLPGDDQAARDRAGQ